MRKLLTLAAAGLLLATVFVWAPQAASAQPSMASPGRKLAFLVGVRQYDHAQLKDLEFAERDVEEFAVVLKSAGFAVVLLTTGTGEQDAARMPTSRNIQQALDFLLRDATKRDLVLVGLAGHGIQPLGSESAYFCPKDANPTIRPGQGNTPSTAARPETLLSIDGLLQTLDESGVGQKLLMMDACRNDPGVRGRRGVDRVKVTALPPETGVLLSCSSGQFAFEHKSWGSGHGAFFHQVIEGFKGAAVDDRDAGVTWDSLVRHVRRGVPVLVATAYGTSGGEQKPNVITNFSDELPVLSRKFQKPRISRGFNVGLQAGQEWSENGLQMKFCWCPPGQFTMGSPPGEPGRDSTNEGQTSVTLTKGFWLGKYEVTQSEWQRLMGTTVPDQWKKTDKRYPLLAAGDTFPMYFVNHDEAVDFCEKLTIQERAAGRLPTHWAYQLPSEAQWEYGCRAGTRTATAFGSRLDSTRANFDGTHPYNGATKGPNMGTAVRVNSYAPNAWGLCDMHGNVWEWCGDWYADQLPGGADPVVSQKSLYRSFRGGSWRLEGSWSRSAERSFDRPEFRYNDFGFRVAAVQLGL